MLGLVRSTIFQKFDRSTVNCLSGDRASTNYIIAVARLRTFIRGVVKARPALTRLQSALPRMANSNEKKNERATGIEPIFEVSRYCAIPAQICSRLRVRGENANRLVCTIRAGLRSSNVRICPKTSEGCKDPLFVRPSSPVFRYENQLFADLRSP